MSHEGKCGALFEPVQLGLKALKNRFWQVGDGRPPIWCSLNPTSGEECHCGWRPERFSTARNAGNRC
jgi:hypothetical protein